MENEFYKAHGLVSLENESRLCAADLRSLFEYNEETGLLIWKKRDLAGFQSITAGKRWNTRYTGKTAGSLSKKHYAVDIYGCSYMLHRVIWCWYFGKWPSKEIDHINGNGHDNRIANLRDVSASVNRRNARRPIRNTSGVIGVYWDADRCKWNAQIKINGVTSHLGAYANKESAARARKDAERLLGFHPNHGRAA